jgi:very-short-patch-repair endonuclease
MEVAAAGSDRPFIADLLCVEASLVVELDGSQHAEAKIYDDERTRYLARKGLRVIRFWNGAVLENRSSVCDAIIAACGGARDERR